MSATTSDPALHAPSKSWGLRTAGSRALLRKGLAARAARLRLSMDRLRRATGGRTESHPRILATACWSFPIYSQTFVYEELVQLMHRGFELQFVFSLLDDRAQLSDAHAALWERKVRSHLDPALAASDLAHYQRRMAGRTAALTALVAEASGMSAAQLRANEHFLMAFSFARLVEACRPDYLHSYFFYEGTFFTFVASYLLGIPRGVSCYADHMLQDFALKLVPLHLRTADVVVATSERIAGELRALHPDPDAGNVLMKPNAIDSQRFPEVARRERQAGDLPTLLSVSRIEPKKGLLDLVEAVRLLRDEGILVRLRIVGAADPASASAVACESQLRRRVVDLALEQVVSFEGRCPQADVLAALHDADIFVAPYVDLEMGDKDGIPTALLEAMSTGIAVVASDAGSIGEVIEPGRNALIVPSRDPRALAGALRTLVPDRALRARLGGEAARTVRDRYDVRVCDAWLAERITRVLAAR